MEELKTKGNIFDPKKIKLVPVADIFPNTWNPKDKETPEFETIKDGIDKKGLLGIIYVRWLRKEGEKQLYEIVDGEQRWTACKQLNYEAMPVYDLEDMPLEEAREWTIWFEQQVPFNEVQLAKLVKDIVENSKEYILPFDQEKIDEYIKMANFSWEEFKNEQVELQETDTQLNVDIDVSLLPALKKWIQEKTEELAEAKGKKKKATITGVKKIQVLEEQMKVITNALDTIKLENNIDSDARALELLAANYLSGAEIVEEDGSKTLDTEAQDEDTQEA